MIKIVEVGIPVYKARETLPNLLDTLVAQTHKNFIVCLSIDGDGENYEDIIQTYIARGLKIRVIRSEENGGPGVARQRILDTTQCDYIMFADADDLLMPRAVSTLFHGIITSGFDMLRSSFIRENASGKDIVLEASHNVVTWFHGKIYRVQYLKNLNLRFLPNLRTDEDAYFNIIAWNCTEKHGLLNEITYIWCDNKKSITRQKDNTSYFIETYNNYIYGQVKALKRIAEIENDIPHLLISKTLINIYYFYMRARFHHCNEEIMDDVLHELREEDWMLEWLRNGQNWKDVVDELKGGQIYEDKFIVFFDENFEQWTARLFRKEG